MDPHQYALYRITTPSGPRWNFYIDNVLKRYLYESDGAVDCWLAGDRTAQWFGETWDGGDGYADANDKLNFTLSAYKSSYTGAWTNPLWDASQLCNAGADNSVCLDHKCDLVGTDRFDIWSVAF